MSGSVPAQGLGEPVDPELDGRRALPGHGWPSDDGVREAVRRVRDAVTSG